MASKGRVRDEASRLFPAGLRPAIEVDDSVRMSETVLPKPEGSRPARRHRLAQIAYAYLTEHLRKPLTVADLCAVSGANERTLQRGFLETYGSTPKHHLIVLRLNGLRRDLLAASAGVTVTKIAADWGFFHFGRLAAEYRRIFGEYPSRTLRRGRGGRELPSGSVRPQLSKIG